ncbi:MAG: tRNA lysidine(34) synthetase TilS [bacterium]|nr:tRNA lysidine(34) synthetase TilS [bacterium]
MIDDFLAYSGNNNLIRKGDRILVGVSGGVDSVVLLDILSKLQNKLGIHIAIAHVNYGLRKEADKDNKFVKDLAKKYELPFFEEKVKLAGGNIEEKARDIRYDFFNEICKQEKMKKVAVAHHKNDLVETFFLNLSRGSGLTGLVSMKPKNGGLIRPLLFSTRREIEKYAKENSLEFVEDITNKDLTIKRNLIRHKVIPEFEKINLDFVQTLAREIQDLRDADDVISSITKKHYKQLVKEARDAVFFSVEELVKINPYLQSEILRESVRYVKGDLKDVSRRNIEDMQKLLKTADGTKEIHLGEGLIVRRTYDKLEIRKEAKSPTEKPKIIRLKMGEEAFFGSWRLFLGKLDGKNTVEDKNLVFLDIKKTPTLRVRCRKAGDRIAIGSGRTKSLQDVFIDVKVPREMRDSYPIVVSAKDEVIWIPGIRFNPEYKSNKDLVSLEATIRYEKTNEEK